MFRFLRRSPANLAAEEALAKAQTAFLTAQAAQVDVMTRFLGAVAELSARRAASVLGARGAKRRWDNAARNKARAKGGCKLCQDPMTRDVTIGMINAHSMHGVAEQPEQPPNGNNPES